MAYKVLHGFEKYVIFDNGRIWSRSKHQFMSPCLNGDGYPSTMFNRKSKTFHILIALAFVPNPDPKSKKEVNHKDGNKQNNHYLNLEWCTRGENIKHAYKLGLRNSEGSRAATAKITESQVREIRRLYSLKTQTQTEIAEQYNLTQANIGYIVNRKSWSHVQP